MDRFEIKDLLYLNKMILPTIITVIYWVGSVLVVLAVLATGLGIIATTRNSLQGLLTILFGIPLGVLGVRLYCELLVVIFKINNNLQKIVDKK
jgi:hypothetical protein